jgi:hypothetical protein
MEQYYLAEGFIEPDNFPEVVTYDPNLIICPYCGNPDEVFPRLDMLYQFAAYNRVCERCSEGYVVTRHIAYSVYTDEVYERLEHERND